MKKLIALCLSLLTLITVCCMTGCSKDGFELVCSVSYTVDGKNKTEYSTWNISYTDEEERHDIEVPGRLFFESYDISFSGRLSKDSKTISSYGILNEQEIGETFYVRHRNINGGSYSYYYKTYKFQGFSYSYVYVKVVDDDTIIIKHNGTTTYNVSSYSITYFN